MKVSEALSKIDLTTGRPAYDIEAFAEALGVDLRTNWSEVFNQRITQYPIQEWMCTDTLVGIHAYFMDGEPVAISVQVGRKRRKEIDFLSKEAADKVRSLLLTLLAREASEPSIISLDKDLPDFAEDHSYAGYFFTQFGKRVS